MCTLSIVPLTADVVRVEFNRDESPTRAAGLPPRVRRFGSRAAVLPLDPPSGGTWLAVNDAGLVLALLNVNPSPPAAGPAARSRGEVIPALLHCDSPAAALAALEQSLGYGDFAPFRLVVLGCGVLADVRWDGRDPMVASHLLGTSPHMYTSSGLGDALADAPRRALFDELFSAPPAQWDRAQDWFHRSRWPGREHLSVNLVRAGARTVSRSVIDLRAGVATFTYHPGAPDAPSDAVALALPLAVECP
ncbi:NRDE family protein [Gemmata sp.]|uniref:NRDE family protein n=1 Tax=Gemmata sp. TaxID=1914242 RepID=UPI003F6FBBA7